MAELKFSEYLKCFLETSETLFVHVYQSLCVKPNEIQTYENIIKKSWLFENKHKTWLIFNSFGMLQILMCQAMWLIQSMHYHWSWSEREKSAHFKITCHSYVLLQIKTLTVPLFPFTNNGNIITVTVLSNCWHFSMVYLDKSAHTKLTCDKHNNKELS